jgi:hypothetical protein
MGTTPINCLKNPPTNLTGTLNMTSGTIALTNVLKIARDPTAIGHVNLDGGIISTNNFLMREKEGSVGTMVVRAGTLIMNGDRLSLVQGYIDQGWIICLPRWTPVRT